MLVDPYGVKIGGPTDRDIADIWTLHPDKVATLTWHDPARGRRDLAALSEHELAIIARNSEIVARFCWDPYMHNPTLKHLLHRVRVPTLFVWGEHDGIVGVGYGRAFSTLMPGAALAVIAGAGHLSAPGAAGRVHAVRASVSAGDESRAEV